MIAGVAIETWKVPTFKRVLDEAGFSYTEHPGIQGTALLKVTCDSAAQLAPTILKANAECKN